MIEDDFDFWGGAEEATGEFESKGGSFEVLPDGTRCLAIIDSIEWDTCRKGSPGRRPETNNLYFPIIRAGKILLNSC